jgi:hypothetical protein
MRRGTVKLILQDCSPSVLTVESSRLVFFQVKSMLGSRDEDDGHVGPIGKKVHASTCRPFVSSVTRQFDFIANLRTPCARMQGRGPGDEAHAPVPAAGRLRPSHQHIPVLDIRG